MARTKSLDTGDSIEYSMTTTVKPAKGVEVWLKVGASTTVREEESGARAMRRLTTFVDGQLETKVDDLIN